MSTFLLVPGASLGRWAFDDVVATLRIRGHRADAMTLTGLADRADEATPDTDLATHAADVVAAVRSLERDDVVLVGHSYGGAVVVEAAREVSGRLGQLVLLAGLVLEPGQSLVDQLPPGAEEPFFASVIDTPRGQVQPPMTMEQLDIYWGDHGLAGDAAAAWTDRTTPHPVGTYRSPAGYGVGMLGKLPRTYLRCAHDPGPDPELSADWDRRVLPTGHWPMLTAPDLLADALIDIAHTDG